MTENSRLDMIWTPYGKVDTVTRSNAGGSTTYDFHTYLYDAMGNQVRDQKYDATTGYLLEETFHIYDGHNTKVAKYTKEHPTPYTTGMKVLERYLYGSERIATIKNANTVVHGH